MPRPKKKETTVPSVDANGAAMPMFADVDGGKSQTSFASTVSRRGGYVDSPVLTYPNLESATTPFRTSGADAHVDTREAVRLSVKAYWAFPLLRNVVEVMGELSNSDLYLKGGNKKTRGFLEAWFERINLWQLKEQFFREWFRSANAFIYRFDGTFSPSDLKKMTQIYGSLKKAEIPVKYIILNPECITAAGNIAFDQVTYFKVLSPYELAKLKNPQTAEEKALVKQLDAESLRSIQAGGDATLKLDPERLRALTYKHQPYEPMGVPMAYGVLKDIEAKLELKRIDLSIARTTDRALLLLTVGETPNEWSKGANINPNTITALQAAFANESVARTLIADYTVKGNWLIPDINKILGAAKYEQIDKDINTGLNAILFNDGEKFANTSIKVQIFIERLKDARSAFLKNFLQPEIERVCEAINAKNVPTAIFEDLSLKDDLQYAKIYVQLAQLGLLTPEELFRVMGNGQLPTVEESLENQRTFKTQRDEGLYLPIVGGAADIQKAQLDIQQQQTDNQLELGQESNKINAIKAVQPKASGPKGAVGRPTGSTGPKAATKPTPVGSGKANLDGFSMALFHAFVPQVSDLHNMVEKTLKKNNRIRKLSDFQQSVGKQLVEAIIANEPQEKWLESVDTYVAAPKEMNLAVASELDDLQLRFNVDSYTASILRLAKSHLPEEQNAES